MKQRQTVTLTVELPTRAELLRDGEPQTQDLYHWRGRLWSLPPRRGRPRLVEFECEYPLRPTGDAK